MSKAPEKPSQQVTPNWEETLYAPERVSKWMRGEMTLQELNAVSGPEMMEMAVTGFSMYEQGRYEDAKVIFQGLCQLDPNEGYYRTALGAVHLAQEDLEMAEKLFNFALQLNPKEIASYVNRGEVYLRQGKILEAAQDFKRAVELDPENQDPLSQRARVLASAALETLETARKSTGKTGLKTPAVTPNAPAVAAAKKK
ncbi:MAG: tetratricopeptide repeat protein [Myxococcaceae bacterium]